MSARKETSLAPVGYGRARHIISSVVGACMIGLLVTGCADSPGPTIAGLPSSARTAASNGAVAPTSDYDPAVPLAYYQLSLNFARRTAGITPPVQARAYGYMGLALYEALVAGMPDHRSIASQLNGIGPLPDPKGIPYNWPLVANAAMSEVMRGLWGDQTNRAADNIADLNALEASFASQYAVGVPPGLAQLSTDFGHSVGAAVFATSRDDGEDRSYLTNFPASYTPPTGPGLWVPTAPGQVAMQPFWGTTAGTFVLSNSAECDPGPPPPYSEQPGSAFYNEAYLDYQISKTLTPEQITIAQ